MESGDEMNITLKQGAAASVILLAAGGAIDHWYIGGGTVTKTQYVDRVVTQYQVVTQTNTVVKPDGSKIITEVVTDNTRKTEIDKGSTVIKTAAPNWHVVGGFGYNYQLQPIYTAAVERRILGPVFVGVQASSEKSASF